MKILMLPGAVFPKYGEHRHILELSTRLARLGMEVHGIDIGRYERNIRMRDNYVVHMCPSPSWLRGVRLYNYNLALMAAIAKLHGRLPDFDLIHAHGGYSSAVEPYRYVSKKFRRSRYVVTLQGVASLEDLVSAFMQNEGRIALTDLLERTITRLVANLTYRSADRFIAHNEYMARLSSAEYSIPSSRIVCIPPGVDVASCRALPQPSLEQLVQALGVQKEQFSFVLYVGALVPRKNVVRIVKAFSLSKKKLQSAKLLLVGRGGPLELRLKTLVRELGIEDDVFFYKKKYTEEEKVAFYHLADVFVMPSYDVGYSTALLEAMAAGKPVIAANWGANPILLSNNKRDNSGYSDNMEDGLQIAERGVLVSPSSERYLAEGIELLLSEKALARKLGERAYTYVEAEFDWDGAVIPRIRDVYRDLLE